MSRRRRRGAILAQTRRLWASTRYADLTLQQVAQSVGLSKPALYAYFPTKEDLFLSLAQGVLNDWFTALEQHLRLGGRHTPASLVGLMVTLIGQHAELVTLIPPLSALFERNISLERARAYKHWLLERTTVLGPLIEQALPGLPAGGGLRLLTYTQALIAGLYPMSDPSASMYEVLSDPELSILRVKFMPALEDALTALCVGLVKWDV